MSKNYSNTYYCSDAFCHKMNSKQFSSVVIDLPNHLNLCWLKNNPQNKTPCQRKQIVERKAFHCTGLLSIHFPTYLFMLKKSESIQKGLSLVYNVENPISQGPESYPVNPGLRQGMYQPQQNKLACLPG